MFRSTKIYARQRQARLQEANRHTKGLALRKSTVVGPWDREMGGSHLCTNRTSWIPRQITRVAISPRNPKLRTSWPVEIRVSPIWPEANSDSDSGALLWLKTRIKKWATRLTNWPLWLAPKVCIPEANLALLCTTCGYCKDSRSKTLFLESSIILNQESTSQRGPLLSSTDPFQVSHKNVWSVASYRTLQACKNNQHRGAH